MYHKEGQLITLWVDLKLFSENRSTIVPFCVLRISLVISSPVSLQEQLFVSFLSPTRRIRQANYVKSIQTYQFSFYGGSHLFLV